jgi:hypothetical protein
MLRLYFIIEELSTNHRITMKKGHKATYIKQSFIGKLFNEAILTAELFSLSEVSE